MTAGVRSRAAPVRSRGWTRASHEGWFETSPYVRGNTQPFVVPDSDPVPMVGRGQGRGYHPNPRNQRTRTNSNTSRRGVSRGRPMGGVRGYHPDSSCRRSFVLPDPDPVPTVGRGTGAATTQPRLPRLRSGGPPLPRLAGLRSGTHGGARDGRGYHPTPRNQQTPPYPNTHLVALGRGCPPM